MYAPENVIWIKNVLRDKGAGWAYEDKICAEPFLLNWPTKKRGSAFTPKVGDIIVLFQRPKLINNKRNSKVHITHLVSPISETIIDNPQYPNHRWCREVIPIAIANPIHSIPNPGYFNFFKPNRGLTNPIINLTNNIGLSEAETQSKIWELFNEYICQDVEGEIFLPIHPVGVYGEIEGDIIVKEHIRQELIRRNSKIIQMAKSAAVERGNGSLLCECCKFDFYKKYGTIGEEFIECHHKIHLNTGERITKIEDLAMVCSNCHRMLHRKLSNEGYHTIESLSDLIIEQNTKSK